MLRRVVDTVRAGHVRPRAHAASARLHAVRASGSVRVVRALLACAVLALTVRASAAGNPADGPPDLVDKAYQAANEKRYCDAAYLFLALHQRATQAKHLYRAAEVAYAAGDYRLAQDLYRSVKDAYPSFEKMQTVQKRLVELEGRLKTESTFTPCPDPPSICGDWIVRPGEQCDDGNVLDGDGCDGNCTITACGNGKRTAPEECDDGNLSDGDGCDGNCTLSRCGNGIVGDGEDCDDGNNIDGDGCDQGCVATRCGNGVVTEGEQCDDGNSTSGDGCDRNCKTTACGNAAKDPGEECDDGNDVDGDGCDRGCSASRCGNGVMAPGEECDDGNLINGDGCDATCRLPARAAGDDPRSDAASEGDSSALPVLVVASGGVFVVAGVVLGVIGAIPAVQHAQISQQITAAEARAASNPDDALADARALQRDAADANARWQSYGAALAIGGGAAAGVGAALIGLGAWLLVDDDPQPSRDDEERVP